MSAPVKYLFDADFSRGAAERQRTISLAAHEAALADKAAASYAAGYAAGKAESAAEAARRSAQALDKAADALGRLAAGWSAIEAKLETEAIGVAVAVARKLSAELIAREPLAEIERVARECFAHLAAAPHVVIRVGEGAAERLRDQLTAAARGCGFEGRLVILGEPDIADGDCRIEWADGGVARERAAIEATIDETVERYMAARLAAAGQLAERDE